MNPYKMSLILATSVFLFSACAVAPGLSDEEVQIRSDLDVSHSLPASRHKDPYLIAEYAAALIASERAAEAIEPLDEALARTPAYGRLWSLKGAALDQQERFGEARQYYNRALQITPNDPNVMANIGFSYALSGDAPKAETWLRRAMAQPGASESVRQNLALVLRLQGKNAEAESLISPNQSRQTFQSQASRPGIRPSAGSNAATTSRGQSIPSQTAQAQIRQPQARVLTSASSGQNFKSSSDAVRAITGQNPTGQRTVTTQAKTVSPELQQATLNRIANSLNLQQGAAQNTSPVTQAPQRAQGRQPYPQTGGQYPAVPQAYPNLAGGPYAQPAQAYGVPQRREPNRRRR